MTDHQRDFQPYPGYDPLDGEEPRVSLSRDNPLSVPSGDTPLGRGESPSATERPVSPAGNRGRYPSLLQQQQNTFMVAATVEDLSYPGLTFELMFEAQHWHLRVTCPEGTCNVTGEANPWNGRWWRISNYATKQEVVGTAFKAVLTALEHEARESFTYCDVPVYDAHMDVDALVQLRRSGGIDERS